MVCPKCGHNQPDGSEECLHCGVIFARIRPTEWHAEPAGAERSPADDAPLSPGAELFLVTPSGESHIFIAGRGLLLVAILVWGCRLTAHTPVSNFSGDSLLHLVNLPFHEAGHVIFSPFGRFIQVLGGSLMQLLVPLVVIIAFLRAANPFAASVGLWWLGESFIDLAPYIDDARAGQMMLLGGVTGSEVEDYHDWENILRTLGWLRYDHVLGWGAHILGAVLMIVALFWGGYIVWRQYRSMAR